MIYNNAELAGQSLSKSAKLFIEQMNATGGVTIDGVAHELLGVFKDCGETQETAVATFMQLIKDDKIAAVIGPTSSQLAIPVAVAAERNRVLMISPSSTNNATIEDKRHVFSAAFSNAQQSLALVEFVRQDLQLDQAAILFNASNEYSRSMAERFSRDFSAAHGEIVAYESYVTGQTSYVDKLQRIKASSAKILFLPNFMEEVELQADMVEAAGMRIPLLGSDSWYIKKLQQKPRSNSLYYSHFWGLSVAQNNQLAEQFITDYRQRYQQPPTAIAALSYDAMSLVVEAIKYSTKDSPAHKRLAALNSFQGVTGQFSFRNTGRPVKPVYIFKVENDQPSSLVKVFTNE